MTLFCENFLTIKDFELQLCLSETIYWSNGTGK